MTLRRSLYAATLTITVTLAWVPLAAHPARADYSDHGTPDVSLIPPTNVERTTSGTPLADTGWEATFLAQLGVVVLVAGLVLVVLSRKPHHRSNR